MSIFNLEEQNSNIDYKIVAGLERLSQVYRILLWQKAKEHGLSPIQIQLLIFIHSHSAEKNTVSYLAREFNLTKATISDAIKVLEHKKLINKCTATTDTRSYTITLTPEGEQIMLQAQDYTGPLTGLISGTDEGNKKVLWQTIVDVISQLNKMKIISIQRTCYNCKHFKPGGNSGYCSLLNKELAIADIRIDCAEFVQ
ncbi:MarR family transcriptional regulator [Flavobacterium cyanobacteriorum]|uniref:MarR family transcriptional regulator n=1 Tax=Flavobacterium cyanobacteriorum TaxID=2022802 RepID=A0A255ZYC4_9FLAO|nr:MarR family winged helix-turn-helix transcriptional regulator [Flavobacterium cyanobacteriorum]OYQ46493.1 MarR family transcriptional regulator [Flavobacterium cyanobacteriorum]